jgi:hypothetical protein
MSQLNTLFTLATRIINHTGRHLFLTGRAGTGKTTFLRHIQHTTPKKAVVVAPTGVAALNAGGVTMHSFFQLPFGMYLPGASNYLGDEWNGQLVVNRRSLFKNIRFTQEKRELLRELELLIIDEVSMLRADALDAIDAILRAFRNKPAVPFGGVQVLFIGDLFQLPPVLRQEEAPLFYQHYRSPFFFSASVMNEEPPLVVELKHIYRQRDEQFIGVLNAIRNNCASEEDLATLHERYKPWQQPEDGSILLTTHNAKADRINSQRLDMLPGKEHRFEAVIERDFNERALPAERFLSLKVGAQVMFIKNDTARRFYNGKLATVFHIGDEDDIWVRLEGGHEELRLERYTWKNIRYKYDRDKDSVEEQELGAFKQYPVRLAWAITIHKSQGLTFERATIDAGASFAPGQVYVALSRLTSLEGMVLHSRIPGQGIEMPEEVLAFCRRQMDEDLLTALVRDEEEQFAQERLVDWFSLEKILGAWALFHEGYAHRGIASADDAKAWSLGAMEQLNELEETAKKFRAQLAGMLSGSRDYPLISERVDKAVPWLSQALERGVMQPLQQHYAAWSSKARSRKYLGELRDLEAVALQLMKGWQQARQLAAGLAGGTACTEIVLDTTTPSSSLTGAINSGEKPRKGDSQSITLAMFREGKSIDEIAAKRGLAVSTVEGHLLSFIPSGEVDIDCFVTPAQYSAIDEALSTLALDSSSSMVKSALGEAYSYTMIRAVQLHRRGGKSGKAQAAS